MTHRDEINNMSNEELADYLDCRNCIFYKKDCLEKNMNCIEAKVLWLNMEVEE